MGGRPLDDRALAERARNGDVAAYERLVAAYQGIAYRMAYVITGSAHDAEDATQDGLVKAYYALGRFREGASFRPWLLTIVANEARNRRRSAGRRAGLEVRVAGERPLGDAASSPEGAALDDERNRSLAAHLERLPERDRRVIVLRYFLDLSEEETAAALGVARGTVKSRLSRALARLRAGMDAEEVG